MKTKTLSALQIETLRIVNSCGPVGASHLDERIDSRSLRSIRNAGLIVAAPTGQYTMTAAGVSALLATACTDS